MMWASTTAATSRLEDAVAEAAEEIEAELDGSADVVFAFATEEHSAHLPNLGAEIDRRFPGALLFGCTGPGVIGGGVEIEGEPALSLTAARLPGVEIAGYYFEPDPRRWSRSLASAPQGDLDMVVLSDPATGNVPSLLSFLDAALPEATKIGGLAGGGTAGESSLLLGDRVHRSGSIALALRGNVEITSSVAQGCRAVGAPMFVTRHRGQLIAELDGQPALRCLDAMLSELSVDDREHARSRLVIGLATSEQEIYEAGDYLIRDLVGIEPESGSIGVEVGQIEPNQVVQFHVRDPQAASEELAEVLDNHIYNEPRGGLLFSGRGRGRMFYGRPNHDSDLIAEKLGPVPIGGFFASGEIGPVAGRSHLHSYSSAFGLFRPKR
jgi:small ligand-binding sensory domain FIST